MPEIICIVECESYDSGEISQALTKAVAPYGGWERFIGPGQKVLLKPNFIKALPPERQAITHPVILRTAAEIVRSRGGRAMIGDSPAFGSLSGVMSVAGVREVLNSPTISVVEFQKKQWVNFPRSNFRRVPVAQEKKEFDVIINLPKLKAHSQLLFSGATKNLFGFVCGRWKAYQHFRAKGERERFALLIAELSQSISPALTIIDAIIGMEGTGPVSGNVYKFGVLLAGTNCFAMDLALAELFNLDWHNVPILKTAHNAGIFTPQGIHLEIIGNAEKIRERFSKAKLPQALAPISFSFPRLIRGFFRHFKEKFAYPYF